MHPQEPHEYDARYESAMDRADGYTGSLEDELDRAESNARQAESQARAAEFELEHARRRIAELEAALTKVENDVLYWQGRAAEMEDELDALREVAVRLIGHMALYRTENERCPICEGHRVTGGFEHGDLCPVTLAHAAMEMGHD